MALKADGSLWAWGYGVEGQLGDGTATDRPTPVRVGSGFSAIAAGDFHSLALKTDGSLWAWGNIAVGQLGDGTTPVQVGNGFTAIAAGGSHSLALKTDGSLWAWGYNGDGQLGDGSYGDASTPQIVINDTLTGILDLDPAVPNAIPSDAVPKLLIGMRKDGDIKSLALSGSVYLGSIDLGERALTRALSVDTRCPTGGVYKIFVAALLPSGLPVTGAFLLDNQANWNYYTGGALPEYLSNIDSRAAQHVDVSILNGVDVSSLIGTQILIGYGTTDQEMLSTGCYRPVYVVQEEPAVTP